MSDRALPESTVTPALYRDPALPIPLRVDDLLSRMTLAEKAGQMLQLDARAGIHDAIHRQHCGSLLHASPERVLLAQREASTTRLGVPILIADDCIHGHSFWPGATIFPTQLGMAATWDAALIERGARATAIEVAATGIHWTFSPVLCIARDLRWGRVGETFGEDPHLIGELGAAMIRGYQGQGLADPTAVLATAKHFAGYSETQGGRDASEADMSPRKLRSWFLPPFERAVREGCRTFMLGYQAIDGVPVTANRWLLDDVLKGEWGFTGTLVTDWDNVGRMVWEQRVVETDREAATLAVQSGNDQIMNTPQFFEAAQEAVAAGELDESLIDAAVRRILTLKFELGLFENARIAADDRDARIATPEHRELNLEMARRSLVLLANDGTLPVESNAPLTIAVIGPNADDPHAQLGDWAGASGQIDWMPEGHPREHIVTVLDGFRAAAPSGSTVLHARGADIGHLEPDPLGATYPDGQPRPPVFVAAAPDEEMLAEAESVARAADLVVVVVGDAIALIGEGRSTATLELQGAQSTLVDRLVATGVPVVLVLIQSKPSTLPESAPRLAAIIEAFNPGMQGGRAVAELVLGYIEPTGRLPISFARHAGQLPVYYNQVRGQHGDRYADLSQDPLFAFGEGLSYTTVEYSGLRLEETTVTADGEIRGSITLTNTGSRPSLETVQVYVRDTVTSVTWADRELKGYVQQQIDPGSQCTVEFSIPATACSVVNADGVRVVEPGAFELLVGRSSRLSDLLSATFRIGGGEEQEAHRPDVD